ncbi:YbaB/EbfC family nucleoid-associated protein [Nocardia sp. NPDC019395]|uniref:YbaB/EbfC family nucleoid-associated protein n=1 Tax=Nocardia sp. NPDC019395 TaxID=3154686 RepID=UPI0033DBBFB9
MDSRQRADFRSATDELRDRVHGMLEAFDRQRTQLADIQAQLDQLSVRAESADHGVQVTVDSAGRVVEVVVTPAAMRVAAEQLSRMLTETIRAAADSVHERRQELLAASPMDAAGIPDLPDLLPGAPSLRDTFGPGRHDT